MFPPNHRQALRASAAAAVLGLFLASFGCQPVVREDRKIAVNADGSAAFQHGQNGLFVTDGKTGKPKRVYEPGPNDLAVGPPAWDPSGTRMVFAVARASDGKKHDPLSDGPADGRRHSEIAVRYVCFLHDPAAADGKLDKLFEATCGHVGYVAAGLAVCWHPDGQKLDFVEQAGTKKVRSGIVDVVRPTHRLKVFDLKTRKTEPITLPVAENVAVAFSPGQKCRLAILGGAEEQSGLWVEDALTQVWWRVPDSTPETAALEHLRQQLPRWSPDGAMLAFVAANRVCVCTLATRQTATWFQSTKQPDNNPFLPRAPLEAYWHPNGTRIGVLDGTRLVLVDASGQQHPVTNSPVSAFAGWDAAGKHLAYVALEPLPYGEGAQWATLLVPNYNARTAVRITDADGKSPGKVVSSGTRATFPHWSSGDPRLSLWITVEPPYWLMMGRSGMPPGDPAALIDPETGKLEWLPVNGTEHAQIGHVDLRAGRIEEAIRRFEDAAAALPSDGKADWMLFRAIALQKAGRTEEAEKTLRRFEPPALASAERNPPAVRVLGLLLPPHLQPPVDPGVIHPRHQFAAESYVSLDVLSEGIDYLRSEVSDAISDRERLSATLALCQLLLLANRRTEYAEVVVDQLLPVTGRVLPSSAALSDSISGAVAMTILPLAVSEFTAKLPEKLIHRVNEKMATWPRGTDDLDFVSQLALRSTSLRLKNDAGVEKAIARLKNHPGHARWELPGDEVTVETLTRIRFRFLLPELLQQALGVGPTARPGR